MDFSKIPTKLNFVNSSLLKNAKYNIVVPAAILERTTSSSSSASTVKPGDSILGTDYQVSDNDVVCGRGKGFYNKPGNCRFRQLVQEFVGQYEQARSKLDKTMVLSAIVDRVLEQGRFVKRKTGGVWVEIGEDQAREKAGHAIREAMAAKSSNSSSCATTVTTEEPKPDVLLSDDSETTQETTCEPERIMSFQWDADLLQQEDQAVHHYRRNSRASFASLRGSIMLPLSFFDDVFQTSV